MTLSDKEELLIDLVRSLPPHEAAKVYTWAEALKDLSAGNPVHWSDSWTDEDVKDAMTHTMRRANEDDR